MAALLAAEVARGDTTVNIHIKLTLVAEQSIGALNVLADTQLGGENEIDFESKEPHVTLFLTTFDDQFVSGGELQRRLAAVVGGSSAPSRCETSVGPALNVSGSYAMLVAAGPCWQTLSDAIVNATADLVSAAAKTQVPDWVEALPEPARSRKIALVHAYGSPNVFGGFAPHVTLAVDSHHPARLATISLGAGVPLRSAMVSAALGTVGVYGTVVRGQDMGPAILLPTGRTDTNR